VGIQSRESASKPQLLVEYTFPITTSTSVCSATGCVESKPWIYTNSFATVVADFNGDGREDHLVERHVEKDQIYLQQPDGSFAPGFLFPGADRHTCAAGRINADQMIDLFCSIGAGGGEGVKRDELWIAKPGGTYVNEAAAWGLNDPYGRGRRPLLFDFDNDGKLDVYTTSVGFRPDGLRSDNILWLNKGDPSTGGGGFVEQQVAATGPLGEDCVAAGDWNRDRYRDFLVCGPVSSPPLSLHLFQNDAGTATVPSDGLLGAPVSSPRDAKLADLNGDGWDDLVVVTRRELQIRMNQACASCDRFSDVGHSVPLVDGVYVAVGDITGDGSKDLYVVQGETENTNAPDLLLAGPDWHALDMPQAEVGVGDTAEIIDILGRKTVIVANGSTNPHYSRGPVQFISFIPNAPPSPPASGGTSGGGGLPAGQAAKAIPGLTKSSAQGAAKVALKKKFGKRFRSKTYRQACKRLSQTRFRCRVSWTIGKPLRKNLPRKRYAGTVSLASTAQGLESNLRITYTNGICVRRSASHGRVPKKCQKRYVT
jgi:hypothetical protein